MNAVQIALIAVGGFLVFKYFSASRTNTLPASSTNSVPIAQPGGVKTEAVPSPSDESLMRAALNRSDASLAGGFKLNWWQWNYYRSEGAKRILGIPDPDPAIYAPDLGERLHVTPEQMLTAGEYHDLLDRFGGLSGLMWS